jgi:putative membrane protein insertion efficiency factor
MTAPVSLPARGLILVVRAYQLALSPWMGGVCRHTPSCSAYAIEALQRFGALRGGWLAACRLARCRPLGTSGYDPVPESDAREGGHRGKA